MKWVSVWERMDFTLRNKIFSIFLIFSVSVAGFLATLYANTLFLSSYPGSWVIYFLLAQSILNILLSLITTHVFKYKIKTHTLILFWTLLGILGLILFLSHHKGYWGAFGISLIMLMVNSLLLTSSWNYISLVFNVREYRSVVIYGNAAACVGNILAGLSVPFLIKYFPLNFIILLIIVFIISSVLAITQLHDRKRKEEKNISEKLFTLPLYKYLVFFLASAIIAQALIDYLFKFELASHLPKNQIAVFLAYFGIATNSLALGISFFEKRFMQIFKLRGVLNMTPLVILCISLFSPFFPVFWIATMLAGTKTLFFNNQTWVAAEILLNIFPSTLRILGKYRIKMIITPLVTVITYSILVAFTNLVAGYLVLIIALISSIGFIWIKPLIRSYRSTLEAETAFQRFNILQEINPANIPIFYHLAEKALKAQNERTIFFGLNLIQKIKPHQYPKALYRLLSYPDELIRSEILKLLDVNLTSAALPFLLARIQQETNPLLTMQILRLIDKLDHHAALEIAHRYIHQSQHSAYPASIGAMLHHAGCQELEYLQKLKDLVSHEKFSFRQSAALIIGHLKLYSLQEELSILINDENKDVRESAMTAAALANMTALIPDILKHLKSTDLSLYFAHQALIKMGKASLFDLTENVKQSKSTFLSLKVIAGIRDPESEKIMLDFAHSKNIYFRMQIAKELYQRAIKRSISDNARKIAVQLALEEAYFISFLFRMVLNIREKFSNHILIKINAEIYARIALSREILLHWLALATDPRQFGRLIPALLKSLGSEEHQHSRAKALELLEIYLSDAKLKSTVLAIFENPKPEWIASLGEKDYHDAWLENIFLLGGKTVEEVKNMDELSKVFDLRNISLFKHLPAEVLLILAKETKQFSFEEGEIIFQRFDEPDGLYCISSGEVQILLEDKVLNILHPHDFFGELALIDDTKRYASAVATKDSMLLFIDKNTFERITDDLPDVFREITKTILKYLRKSIFGSSVET